MERQSDNSEEQWRLELGARVGSRARGKRCGVLWVGAEATTGGNRLLHRLVWVKLKAPLFLPQEPVVKLKMKLPVVLLRCL
jgi:hypothetical protein